MVKINFLDKNDNLKEIEANLGSNLLEVSKKNNTFTFKYRIITFIVN